MLSNSAKCPCRSLKGNLLSNSRQNFFFSCCHWGVKRPLHHFPHFLFELEEFTEREFEPQGTKNLQYPFEDHLYHWSAWWEDLDPVSLAECVLAVKLFTLICAKDYRFFVFFLSSFCMLNIVPQFPQHSTKFVFCSWQRNLLP